MELTNMELAVVETTAANAEETQQRVLTDLSLVLMGGGLAEASLY